MRVGDMGNLGRAFGGGGQGDLGRGQKDQNGVYFNALFHILLEQPIGMIG